MRSHALRTSHILCAPAGLTFRRQASAAHGGVTSPADEDRARVQEVTLMATILLEPPTRTHAPATILDEEHDRELRDMSCPVCGSGMTYQLGGGRWGCTQCGSSWG